MSLGKLAKDILTLGAQDTLTSVRQIYESAYAQYEDARERYDTALSDRNYTAENLSTLADRSIEIIEKSYAIILFPAPKALRTFTPAAFTAIETASDPQLAHVGRLIRAHSAAQSAAGGAGAGSAMALGSWSLVSSLGTASTGAAIGGLHGIAATNATLAWFGGGALAAGGAGMAGGALVLGGIAALPVIAFSAFRARAKIKELISETEKITTETGRMAEAQTLLIREREIASQLFETIITPHEELAQAYDEAFRIVFPIYALSRLRKLARRMLGMPVFNNSERECVRNLKRAADRLSAKFQTETETQAMAPAQIS